MDKTKILKQRHVMLENLKDELNAAEIAAELGAEEDGFEMVTTMLDEVGDTDSEMIGEFFFRPLLTEEDEVQYFAAVLTLPDEIPADRLPALYEAVSYVNFTLPAGCFSIDMDHQYFCYVLSVPLPIDLEDGEVFREMDLAAGNAMAIADAHVGILLDVINGREGIEGVRQFLGGE